MEALRERVTCPVCYEIPRQGGFFQCPNGHLVCERDFESLSGPKMCPECRTEYRRQPTLGFKPPRSPLAEEVLQIIRIPCRWSVVVIVN